MTEGSAGQRDFFVSFNQADRTWATWIAWVLEEAGYSVWFQDWDFRGRRTAHSPCSPTTTSAGEGRASH